MEFQIEKYRETFDRAIEFAKTYPDTLWCYGNHDVSYPWGRLETGYSPYAERTVMSKLEELENSLQDSLQIAIMHWIDNVLFSHGGLSVNFLRWLNEELLEADIYEVVAAVNDASKNYLWNDESPLWLRSQNRTVNAFRNDTSYADIVHNNGEDIAELYDPDQGARIKKFEITDKVASDFFMMFCRGRKDDDSWKEEINALRCICKNLGVEVTVERSRSGRGAHLWIFFKEIDGNDTPWDKNSETEAGSVKGVVHIILDDRIYMDSSGMSNKTKRQLRRMATFSNKQYFQNQAMDMPNYDASRFIYLGSDEGKYIVLPRGLREEILNKFDKAGISYKIEDKRTEGQKLNISFKGSLRESQIPVVETMLENETGIL